MTIVHEGTLWRGSDVALYKTDSHHCMCRGKMCAFQGAYTIFEMVNNSQVWQWKYRKQNYRIFTIRDR